MWRFWKRSVAFLTLAAAVGLWCLSPTLGAKPPGPVASYTLTDLLGFHNPGYYQSVGEYITNRENGAVLIYGISYLSSPDGPTVQHPALWTVDSSGAFPDTDPVDMGVPDSARELRPAGINRFGVAVGSTGVAKLQDENGNWVFPSYVDVPGLPYQELPSPVRRWVEASGINDAGFIVGTYTINSTDPNDEDGLENVSGIWQVQADGFVTDPRRLGSFFPTDINNYGVMAGHDYNLGAPAVAWFENDALMIKVLEGQPQLVGSAVVALNDYPHSDSRLTVVGHFALRDAAGNLTGDWRGFAWRPWDTANPTTPLGTLGGRNSFPQDVNRAGEIVGYSDTKRSGQQAFLFKNGQMLNLNSMAAVGDRTLQYAYGINDDGDIVGFMGIPRPISEQRGFLLRRIVPNSP